jgi:pimeloyl-ACP methyl ester carboxylesterase
MPLMATPRAEPIDSTGTLVFSHGNGFPAGTYGALFEVWKAAGLRVEAVERFGHDPRFPVTTNWPHLRDQLLTFVEELHAGPVWLVGHSLGGLLSLMAACWKPRLVRGIVLLDSPVVTGWRAHSLRVIKASGLIGRVSPGRYTRNRRQQWDSREAVMTHFSRRGSFARWAPQVLADYVEHGFIPAEGGVRLAFDRDIETRIYNTLPHNLDRMLRRHPLQCAMGFIAGSRSTEMRQGGVGTSRRLAGPYFQTIEGTHLFPMERPGETAQRVLDLLRAMNGGHAP